MSSTPYKLILGGREEEGQTTLTIRNPFSGDVVGSVFLADASQAQRAVETAKTSLSLTRRLSSYERSDALRHVSNTLKQRANEFAELITSEIGKPIRASHAEVERAVVTFSLAAEEALRISGETLPLDLNKASRGRFGIVRRFPVGPVLAITPFNFPLNLVAHKIAPAMAAGNPWILKPPPQAPLTSMKLAEIILASGYPREAVNVLPCDVSVAEQLARHEDIAMLSFTGSPAVGWALKSKAGRKKVLLELGGNAGTIIDESVNPADVVRSTVAAAFVYAGQVCIRTQRIYVHARLYEAYKDLFIRDVCSLGVGDPANESVTVGPMIDDAAADRVSSWIQEAVTGGAKILCGGERNGRIIQPTVLEGAKRTMKVFCEEIFGPVVTLHKVESFAEAVDGINDSRFGLQAGVFSNNFDHILYAYERLHVGGVILNDNPTYRVDHMPYGGIKESGFGREGIRYAIEAMTEPKLLVVHSSGS